MHLRRTLNCTFEDLKRIWMFSNWTGHKMSLTMDRQQAKSCTLRKNISHSICGHLHWTCTKVPKGKNIVSCSWGVCYLSFTHTTRERRKGLMSHLHPPTLASYYIVGFGTNPTMVKKKGNGKGKNAMISWMKWDPHTIFSSQSLVFFFFDLGMGPISATSVSLWIE